MSVAGPAVEPAAQRVLGLLVAARERVRRDVAVHDSLPETAALVRIRDRGAHALAPATGERRDRAEPLREQRLEQALDPAREHRREAAAADRDRYGGAVDDGGHHERAELRIVDDVAEPASVVRVRRDSRVDRAVVGRGNDQPVRVERFAPIGARVVRDSTVGRKLGERLRQQRRGHHVNPRAGLEQQ